MSACERPPHPSALAPGQYRTARGRGHANSGERLDSAPFLAERVAREAAGAVEDHGRAAGAIVGGPVADGFVRWVARAGEGGADVFWNPVTYEPPTPEFGLGGYVIQVVERGADGATGPSQTLDAPADATEIYVDNLINGRIYEITVAAYAMRKDASKADGDPESYATYPGAKSSPVTVGMRPSARPSKSLRSKRRMPWP